MKSLRFIYFALSLIAVCALAAGCDDTVTTIGSSLVEDKVDIVVDSTFTVTGRSVVSDRVQSRTITQLLGRLEAQGYGRLSSDVVTQFMPGLAIDTEEFTADDIDSVKLVMQMTNGAYIGDSIMPMGVKVYPLTKQLPAPIYSDFDPTGYYDPNVSWGRTTYTASAIGASDSIRDLKMRAIQVMLPRQFAVDIYNEYKTSPVTFQNPTAFAQFFPGLYIANSFGNGRVTRIDKSFITMYYHVHSVSESTGNDTIIYQSNTYLAVTPEIVTNNNIDYAIASSLQARVSAGETLIVAPTGYDVEITLPGRELVDYYRAKAGPIALINTLSLKIPAEKIANDYSIEPPATLLLVKKTKLDEFFAKNMIPDGESSFYASYSATTGVYEFTGMRGYIEDLLTRDEVTDEDVDFVLVPVTVATESVSSGTAITAITPYIATPAMCGLKLGDAKVTLTFSKQEVTI